MPSPLIIPVLFLLTLANATPWLVQKLVGDRLAYPVDGNREFVDGKPLLGPSKTLRGISAAILVTMAGAALIGLGWWIGFLVGGFAMMMPHANPVVEPLKCEVQIVLRLQLQHRETSIRCDAEQIERLLAVPGVGQIAGQQHDGRSVLGDQGAHARDAVRTAVQVRARKDSHAHHFDARPRGSSGGREG